MSQHHCKLHVLLCICHKCILFSPFLDNAFLKDRHCVELSFISPRAGTGYIIWVTQYKINMQTPFWKRIKKFKLATTEPSVQGGGLLEVLYEAVQFTRPWGWPCLGLWIQQIINEHFKMNGYSEWMNALLNKWNSFKNHSLWKWHFLPRTEGG